MEFKVGDRVRVINDEQYSGLIGEIVAIIKDRIDGSQLWFHIDTGEEYPYAFLESQIELYEEKEEDFIVLDNKNQQVRVLTQEQIKLEELEQRIEKLEKQNNCQNEQNNLQICKISTKKEEIISKSQLLSEDERVILRNLDKMYKYIARDFNDELDIYEKCPEKKEYFHSAFCWRNGGCCESLDMFPNLFKFIKSMEEPYNIEELLKGESEE